MTMEINYVVHICIKQKAKFYVAKLRNLINKIDKVL